MKKEKVFNIAMILVMTFIIFSDISFANNWQDTAFNFYIQGGYGSSYSNVRNKMDTSKVYFKNLIDSHGGISLIIQGSNSSTGTFTNCNYNKKPGMDLDDPYYIENDSVGDYYSSTVYETYHNSSSPNYPKARLGASGLAGSYYTIWSPDNYHGY